MQSARWLKPITGQILETIKTVMTAFTPDDLTRIADCLAFIKANPGARYPLGWIAGIQSEAREAGLLPPLPAHIGCNIPAKPGFEFYGSDYPDL